jgi:predicted nucleic acid binding AN1-type Zn finger protein
MNKKKVEGLKLKKLHELPLNHANQSLMLLWKKEPNIYLMFKFDP